jgi:ribokinase
METPLETVRTAANLATSAGVPLILNPAPARKLPRALLRAVSILTPNESEAEALTGIQLRTLGAAKQAARKLRTQGVRTVVLTLGARGALLADEQGERLIPGLRVRAIDTTGAGDVFNGALAVAISEGQSIDLAVRFANTAAALSVTRRGAQSAAPTRALIERLLRTSARNAST